MEQTVAQIPQQQSQHQHGILHRPEVELPVTAQPKLVGNDATQSETTDVGSNTDKNELLPTDSQSEIQSENDLQIQSEETVPDDQSESKIPEKLSDIALKNCPDAQPFVEQQAQTADANPVAVTPDEPISEAIPTHKQSFSIPQDAPLGTSAATEMHSGDTTNVKPAQGASDEINAKINSLQPSIPIAIVEEQRATNEDQANPSQKRTQELKEEAAISQQVEAQKVTDVEPCAKDDKGSEVQLKEAVEQAEAQLVEKQLAELEDETDLETKLEHQQESELAAQPGVQLVSDADVKPNAQSNIEIDVHLPTQPELQQQKQLTQERLDSIIPPARNDRCISSDFVRSVHPGRKPMASSLKRLSNGSLRSNNVLSLPYPIEQCGADMQRAFPGQIGRFYVTNAYCYAYACNRMSIDMAAESMGFEKRDFWGEIRSSDDEKKQQNQKEQQQQPQQPPEVQEPVVPGKRIEQRMADLERDLQKDHRLTLMIMKPDRMNWNKLGNCLVFERCHPHRHYIADKWQMFLTLRRSSTLRHMQMTTASGKPFDFNNFILYTANPGYYQRDLMQYLDSHPGLYILKRTNYSQGIGIRMYRAERPNTVDRLRECIGNRAHLNQFVLQKYIERPLLVDKRKFDLRVYMMLLSCKRPSTTNANGFEYSYFAFCYPGYVKLSCYPYSKVSRDLHVHLTNQFVQKQRWSMYTRVKEATTWFPDELNSYLNRRGRAETDWCKDTLYGRIRAIVGYVAAAFRPHLESNASPTSVFRLYGPDFIIDEDFNVWLLEVNTFPAYSKNTAALSGSIRNMWREAVTVATETTLRYRNRLPVNGLTSIRNFRLAYSSEDPGLLSELVKQSFA